MKVMDNLKKLGLMLPPPPAKGGIYSSVKLFGHNKKLVSVAGCGSGMGEGATLGIVGKDLDSLKACAAAQKAMLNMLANLNEFVPGGLNKVKSCIKLTTYVQCLPSFHDMPAVANAGTQLLEALFGPENGAPTRCAIGVTSLPYNQPVLSEALFELG
jgi:enamine deaminase RidA (YjgF/YER057c/UK114 family)